MQGGVLPHRFVCLIDLFWGCFRLLGIVFVVVILCDLENGTGVYLMESSFS